MRIIGIDHGQRRIGVAVSDEKCRIALPLCVVDGKKSLKAQFAEIFDKYEISEVVVGDPLNLEGESGKQSEKARRFADRIEAWFGLKCRMWDERFTSLQADSAARKSGSHKDKGKRDMAAATLILQSYLDFTCRENRQ